VTAQVRPTSRRRPEPPAAAWVVDPVPAGALAGIAAYDAVVCCIGQRHVRPSNPLSPMAPPVDLCERVALNLVASGRPGQRVLVVSAAGVGDSRAQLPLAWRVGLALSPLEPAYRDLERMERTLEASALDWVALRPVLLTRGEARPARVVRAVGAASRIGRTAVAALLVALAERTGAVDGTRTPIVA
jgi:nucleoside-diphosphate-sugar epimerase